MAVKFQWLEHILLIYSGWFKLVFESVWNSSDSSRKQIFRDVLRKFSYFIMRGWSGMAKVSCVLRHRGVQLMLVYSLARLAILVAGKGRRECFISSVSHLSFLFLFLPCPSLSSPLLSLLSLFSLSLGDDTKWPTRVDVSLNPNTINQLSWKCMYSLESHHETILMSTLN